MLSSLVLLSAFRLDMSPLDIYIQPDDQPNAYCAGFWGRHWMVVTSSLINMCTPSELLFVLGHEMGHAKREHTSWLLLASPRHSVTIPIIQNILRLIFNRWSLKAEYTADRAGLLACRDVSSAISALVKVHFRGQPINVADFIASSELGGSDDPLTRFSEYFGDHPYLWNRIANIQRFHDQLAERGIL